jgi:glycosyltransferase involved in cell wall biosynthesis
MTRTSLVSVVVPFLNAGRFLPDAVEGVFGQTYRDWELLLVDDGSTDASTEMARAYARQHPGRVRYLEHVGHRNLGTSASRNLGIWTANGEHIALLDSDDAWLPAKLEQQLAILDAHRDVALIYGNRLYWESWTGKPEDAGRDRVSVHRIQADRVYRPPALLELTFAAREATIPCGSDPLFRRDMALRVGGYEPSFRDMFDDQVFLAKVYLEAGVFVASTCWTRYRLHPDSCVATWARSGDTRTARVHLLTWLEAFLDRRGMGDGDVWRAVRSELWRHRHPGLAALSRALTRSIGAVLPRRLRTRLRSRHRGRAVAP